MPETVIKFEHFGFKYKAQEKPTLRDINLEISQGEKILILGSSGSGKTTLANCVNGLVPFGYEGVVTGSLKVRGHETRDLSIFKLSKMVGTVLQDSDAQFVGLSVGEDIAFAMENEARPRSEMARAVCEYASVTGMRDFIGAVPFDLSGGQKQKVAISGVLGSDVKILIFDEPLASLDPQMGETAVELIDKLAEDGKRTIIIIEHRLEDVLHRKVDRIVLMSEGMIIADTTPEDILKGGLLARYGIREPLYITAMKYAGCSLEGNENLCDIHSIKFSEENERKLKSFFAREPEKRKVPAGEEIINFNRVGFAYEPGVDVIDDVSFSIRRGERVAVIGKNGAGKSTMAKLICGIARPQRGSITIGGQDHAAMSIKQIGECVGYVMQNPNQMIIKTTIKDEVEYALTIRKTPREEIVRRATAAMGVCGLYDIRNWPVDTVSYGQKKRITVASILVLEPDVIILDEPSAGQDYRSYTDIMDFIDTLNRDHGKTIIFITHDMHLALENTDRALVFADGKRIADDSVSAVLADDDVIKKANLKQTSLYTLARILGLPPKEVTRKFIQHEREAR